MEFNINGFPLVTVFRVPNLTSKVSNGQRGAIKFCTSKRSFTERSQSTLQILGAAEQWQFPEETAPCSLWLQRPNAETCFLPHFPRTSSFFPVHHGNSRNERSWAPPEFQTQCEKPLPHGQMGNRYTALIWLVSVQPISHLRILSLEVRRVARRLLSAVHGSAAGVSKHRC